MPRSKKSYAKKKPYRKGGFKRAVAKVIRSVMPKPEKKFLSLTSTDASIDIAGVLVHLSAVAQGDDVSNRTGNDITCDYIDANITLSNLNAGTSLNDAAFLRCMIVQDTQQNNANPTIAQVLESVTPSSHLNIDNIGRFKVLYDWKGMLNVPNLTGASTMATRKFLHVYKKLYGKSRKIEYTGANATDVHNNNLYAIFITDTDEVGTFFFDFRMGYYDN